MKIKMLSIATFNVQGTPIFSADTYNRIRKIAEVLNSTDVDIINLQEIFTYQHLVIFKKILKNFHYCLFQGFIFGPKGGLVTFSKVSIEKQKYISYSSVTLTKKLFLSKGILINKIKNSSIFIVNTHLTANRDNNWSKNNRFYLIHKNQITEFSNIINRIQDYDFVISGGDFNISKKCSLYRQLIAESKSQDLFKKYGFPTFHKEFMTEDENSHRIDYLLIKVNENKFSVVNKEHIFAKQLISEDNNRGFLSDHVGLKTIIKFA